MDNVSYERTRQYVMTHPCVYKAKVDKTVSEIPYCFNFLILYMREKYAYKKA